MNSTTTIEDGCTDLLRLSPNELSRLTALAKDARDDATAQSGQSQMVERREARRVHLGNAIRLVCEIQRTDNRPVKHMVKCFDLSSTGIGFLHGAYIHPDTHVVLTMLSKQDSGFRLRGNVARCRHLTRHVHEVGVAFESAVDICVMLEMLGIDPSLVDECTARIGA